MTLEFDPTNTASPEDLFGRKGKFLREVVKVERYIRVCKGIEELKTAASKLGFQLTDIRRDWILHKEGQTLAETPLSFIQDPVDEHLWIAEQEFDKYVTLFGAQK